MSKPTKPDWEKRFDDEFSILEYCEPYKDEEETEKIKHFISQELERVRYQVAKTCITSIEFHDTKQEIIKSIKMRFGIKI